MSALLHPGAAALDALIGPASSLFKQQPRQRGQKWVAYRKGHQTTPNQTHYQQHLDGGATYACSFVHDGSTRLIVADDDHGGIDQAQRTIDHLASVGIVAFAIARRSIDANGQPKHDGSHVFIPLDQDSPSEPARAAAAALLSMSGYCTDEVARRCELPFGKSSWTPAGDEYGQLITAGNAPQRITSGEHGMSLIQHIAPNSAALVLSFAPQTAQDAASQPRTLETHQPGTLISGGDKTVVATFNARYTLHDILCNHQRIGGRNYRCQCPAHPHGDTTPSIGIDAAGKLAYFNAPACQYHNHGRPYTEFSLFQHLQHGGDYRAAIDAARAMLGMPKFRSTPIKPAPILKPAGIPARPAAAVAAALADVIDRAANDYTLKLSTRKVLETIVRHSEHGTYAASWQRIAVNAGYSEPTARRAVADLQKLGYIAVYADATASGAYAPNVLMIAPNIGTGGSDHCGTGVVINFDQPDRTYTIKEEEVIPSFVDYLCYAPADEETADSTTADDFLLFNSPLGSADHLPELSKVEWFLLWDCELSHTCDEYGLIVEPEPATAPAPAMTAPIKPVATVEPAPAPARYVGTFGPNKAAAQFLASYPDYNPDMPDMTAPPAPAPIKPVAIMTAPLVPPARPGLARQRVNLSKIPLSTLPGKTPIVAYARSLASPAALTMNT